MRELREPGHLTLGLTLERFFESILSFCPFCRTRSFVIDSDFVFFRQDPVLRKLPVLGDLGNFALSNSGIFEVEKPVPPSLSLIPIAPVSASLHKPQINFLIAIKPVLQTVLPELLCFYYMSIC
jgi:hypothetical protein